MEACLVADGSIVGRTRTEWNERGREPYTGRSILYASVELDRRWSEEDGTDTGGSDGP